jgi:ATP adenylyltransferase
MKQLWAPWRMAYLNEAQPVHGCVFCVKAHEDKDNDNYVIHRGDRCFALLNLYPYNSGHLLIVPYLHTGDFSEIDEETGRELFATSQLAMLVFNEVMHPEGFNLGVNQGKAAGAGIADHIHLHLVPRWGGDTNFMPILADAKVMPELLTATALKLREGFARHSSSS